MTKYFRFNLILGLCLLCGSAYADDYARRFPTDTALLVYSKSSADTTFLKLDCSNDPLNPNIDVFDSIQHCVAPATYTNDTLLAAPGSATDTGDVLNVISDFLYLGKDTTFTDIYFDFVTIMSSGTNRRWEYSVTARNSAVVTATLATTVMTVTAVTSGEIHIGDTFTSEATTRTITAYGTGTGGTGTYTFTPTGGTVGSAEYTTNGTWEAFTPVTDGTLEWQQDGVVNFAAPGDWVTATVNAIPSLYWVRVGTASGTFSTEPTLRICVPAAAAPSSILEIYSGANGIPDFIMDNKGRMGMGYLDPSTYKLRILGTAYASTGWYGGLFSGTSGAFSSTITDTLTTSGYTHVGGVVLNGPAGTALLPSMNSPVTRYSAQAWNGFITKINAMDIYYNPNADPITNGRIAFKNTTSDGYATATEIMNVTSDGNVNILGQAQSQEDTFDRILHFVSPSTYTDDTAACRTLGVITGDVLNVYADYFYIGKRNVFESMYFDFDTIMSDGTTRTWQYWDGDSWETITTIVDGTDSWNNDGTVTFTAPGDWATTTIGTTTAQCGPIYWVRVGTSGTGTFTIEPTLRFCLPAARPDIFTNGEFDDASVWTAAGDWAYSTLDYTFTYNTGSGTLTQTSANFATPAKANTWYRFRYVLGTAGPSTSKAWIGEEFSDGKTYFQTTSTTEVDVFFKTNSNPGDFVIYTTDTATSGMVINAVELLEMNSGNLMVTGKLTGAGRGSDGISIDENGNVGIKTTTPAVDLDVAGDILATGTGQFGNLTVGSGSITDSSGAISFGDENLLTTGTLGAGAITGTSLTDGTLTIDNGSITSGITATFDNFISTTFAVGTGGTITYYTSAGVVYAVHTFLTDGTFVAPAEAVTASVLAIAGGGGGSSAGGGAGGYQYNAAYALTASQSVAVTVGTGGLGKVCATVEGDSGTSSIFGTITATGGGGGNKSDDSTPINGGCGGGGGASSTLTTLGGTGSQGYDGAGNGAFKASRYPAGGGGGTSAPGTAATGNSIAGNGGAGTSNSITGTPVTYGGGGGGGCYVAGGTLGTGGAGGGGAGGDLVGGAGTDGLGGGGGGTANTKTGGKGGNGVVIISYAVYQPYATTSTLVNTNLNADLLDGYHYGTSGATYPLLSGTNTFSAPQEMDIADIGSTFDGDYALMLKNPTASDGVTTRQISPAIILSGQGRGAVNQQQQWANVLQPDPTTSNMNYTFWYKQGAGAWTQYPFLMDISNGFYLYKNSLAEVINVTPGVFWMANVSNSTVGSDQYSPTMTWISQGWKTAATAGTQYMEISHLNAPEQGTISPIGVHKWVYGINGLPDEANEVMRLQWGSDAGVTGVWFNKLNLADYVVAIVDDSTYLKFGTGLDAGITYDGTNMLLNPKLVGSGYLNIQGQTLVDDKIMLTQTDGNEYIDSLNDGYVDIGATTGIRVNNYVRHTSANYRRYYHLPISGVGPGATGPTWTEATVNNMAGWQLNVSTELLNFDSDVHSDWDGASDFTVDIYFQLLSAGSAGDTVDFKMNVYYMTTGDSVVKTQSLADVVVTTDGTQYKMYKATFTVPWDAVADIEVGDRISYVLNLETDTSEIDNILVVNGSVVYNTTHLGIESTDT